MSMKEKITEALSLPKEIALNLPHLTAIGSSELNIENYKNLLEFTQEKVLVRTKTGVLLVEGENLLLKQVTTENIMIVGKITATRWEE